MPYDLISGLHAARTLRQSKQEFSSRQALALAELAERERHARAMEALQQSLQHIQRSHGQQRIDLEGRRVGVLESGDEREQTFFDMTLGPRAAATKSGAQLQETEAALAAERLRRLEAGLADPNVQAQVGLGYSNLGQRKAEHDFDREQATSPQARLQQALQGVLMQTQAYRNLIGTADTGFGSGPVFLPDFVGGPRQSAQADEPMLTIDQDGTVSVPDEATAQVLPPGTRYRLPDGTTGVTE